MGRKRTKKSKEKKTDQVEVENKHSTEEPKLDTEQQIKLLIEKGLKKGYLTYEEMNEDLPEDAISAGRLDLLLATLDAKGISLIDEADVESQKESEDEFTILSH